MGDFLYPWTMREGDLVGDLRDGRNRPEQRMGMGSQTRRLHVDVRRHLGRPYGWRSGTLRMIRLEDEAAKEAAKEAGLAGNHSDPKKTTGIDIAVRRTISQRSKRAGNDDEWGRVD